MLTYLYLANRSPREQAIIHKHFTYINLKDIYYKRMLLFKSAFRDSYTMTICFLKKSRKEELEHKLQELKSTPYSHTTAYIA